MNDSDPRPMPPQVLAAYRDPLKLTELLASIVFTDIDRLEVRDELLDRLIRKHGNIEVEFGGDLVPVRTMINFANATPSDVWQCISIMVQAEGFGGKREAMIDLAVVMQPRWAEWWIGMRWSSFAKARECMKAASIVLGGRQLAWLAAQYARSVIDLVEPSFSFEANTAILCAEAWSARPSPMSLLVAKDAAASLEPSSAARATSFAAAVAAYAGDDSYHPAGTILSVIESVSDADDEAGREDTYRRLSAITKRLITPTLITHASRGLR